MSLTSKDYNDIPSFGERYLEIFDPVKKSMRIRRKKRAEGNIGIDEAMELVSRVMRGFQGTFVPNSLDPKTLLFPFLFNRPKEGDKILNATTKETYTIDQVPVNPNTGNWDGIVKLEQVYTPPSLEDGHYLKFLNPGTYIRFDHEEPNWLPNPVGANREDILNNSPPIKPTVTWSIKKVEPGGMGRPFDPKKIYKPRIVESVKDPLVPGYTVEIYGQEFDNIVQFDAWSNTHRSTEALIRWFQSFLNQYIGELRKCGIAQMFFWQRLEDNTESIWRQALPVRSIQYYMRTQELEAVYSKDLVKLDIVLNSETGRFDPIVLTEPRYIAGQLVSGRITSEEYRNLFYRSGQYLFGDLVLEQ